MIDYYIKMLSNLIKWSVLGLIAYLYIRYLVTSQSVLSHFRVSAEDPHLSDLVDKVVLSKSEEAAVIMSYARREREIKVQDNCAIGVGYTTCMDIGFRAVDMFAALRSEIEVLRKIQGGEFVPQVHEKIAELHEFVETFLYYFSQGVNAERVAVR